MARRSRVPDCLLRRGERISDRVFDSVVFGRVDVEQGPPDDQRPVVERTRLRNAVIENAYLSGLVLRDVVLEDVRFRSLAVINFAVELERVTLRGSVGPVVFAVENSGHPAPGYREHLAALDDANETWSLDVSEARGDIDVRGYAGSRLRLNPAHQTYVPRAVFRSPEWREFTERGVWESSIRLAEAHDHDFVFLAGPASKYFDEEKEFVRVLRQKGFGQ